MAEPAFQFEPIRFVGQLPIDSPNAIESYMTNALGPLAASQAELHWHVSDLCRFHQIMYADLRRQSDRIDERFAEFKKQIDAVAETIEDSDDEGLRVQESRFYTAVMDKDSELHRVRRFSDEFSVVGLWATAEQYLNRVFIELESAHSGNAAETVEAPFGWNALRTAYSNKGIELSRLHGFADTDECRVLNNTIKHAGHVNDRLANYSYFTPHLGSKLPDVDFEMQRYLTGVYHFLGALIESANRTLDPQFPM